MEGASLHVPEIAGAGLGVSEGKDVSVGIGVSVFTTRVSVGADVGEIVTELLQELWATRKMNVSRK